MSSDWFFTKSGRFPPAGDHEDYYKEVEVRINPEGIAVVRRRHNAKPDKQK